ncbi:MAG TPA: nickel-type superoxide dismutase maturation protease [Acidimicrobiales bacterium]|nr:nickel-type superoxide dismutase maturation protease [Acidimicrobiales bacterium]
MRRSARHYLVAVVVVFGGLWLQRRQPFGRVEVVGDSMLPALAPGDRLVLVRGGRAGRAGVGDIVAVSDPRTPARTLVKRVAARGSEGVVVLGDNIAASTDSRALGPVAEAAIRGRAVYRYFPESRRGRL